MKNCVHILMEGSPTEIDTLAFKNELAALPDVDSVHDFHVWCLSQGKYAMSAHVAAK